MRIRKLENNVINQISAGEVIDRPVSVVRELVDNAIDAGATEVTVRLEQGGQLLVEVTDNGCGMDSDDALLAFERHATSKISQADELVGIRTLGFRGEALPSIASVSMVTLRTQSAGADLGSEVIIEAGEIKKVTSVSMRNGCVFQVRNLFYNTPARKKFLKSPKNDELKVKEWIQRSALIRPNVRYRLLNEEKELVHLPPRESFIERLQSVFKGSAVTFQQSIGPMTVSGLVCHPELAQFDGGSLVVFVNGRLVTDKMILKAVKQGFDSTLKDREVPLGAISIELLPQFVDVNVHPQKSEVRFTSSQAVFAGVYQIVKQSVQDFKRPVAFNSKSETFVPSVTQGQGYEQPTFGFTPGVVREEVVPPVVHSPATQAFHFSELRYIGQALDCFLLCELDGLVYVVDMHAAHERYNFNLFRNRFLAKSSDSQKLLMPVQFELDPLQVENLRVNAATLEGFGFEFTTVGESQIQIQAVPTRLKTIELRELFMELGDLDFSELMKARIDELVDHIAARMACHASIRAGDKLSKDDVYALFAELDRTEFSAACPHGRPVIVSFRRDQIESWFGRDH